MDLTNQETYDVGVAIGRWQVDALHPGHLELLQTIIDRHDKVIVGVGISPIPNSRSNPLDFESRMQMIHADFPNLIVLPIMDMADDVKWSKQVDSLIHSMVGPNQTAVLYGSRDSFMGNYFGKLPTLELKPTLIESGTKRRAVVARAARGSADWRAGAIWASQQRFPIVNTAVDIAITNKDRTKILMGKRDHEPAYRLPGGFSDPEQDGSFKDSAIREAMEETCLKVRDLEYVDDAKINDWRYRSGPDAVFSILYTGWVEDENAAVAADDLDHVKWFDITDIDWSIFGGSIMPFHLPFFKKAVMHINKTHKKGTN